MPSKLQPVETVSVCDRHGDEVLRRSGKNIGLNDASEGAQEVGCVFNRKEFTGRAGPGEISISWLGAGLDFQRQGDSSSESGDLHRTPAIDGGVVAALALGTGSRLPHRP